jgi:hypothetical protein
LAKTQVAHVRYWREPHDQSRDLAGRNTIERIEDQFT